MYQAGGTIKDLLTKVEQHDYILPAIQREFVWKPEQICQLFDSLLQGYPFGTFLFWKIKSTHQREYQFYDFMRHYHQRDRVHCEKLDLIGEQDRVAVLDGQQRMTALNIGLRGSYSWKTQGKWWSSPDAFIERRLYLNLLVAGEVEGGARYDFRFLSEEEAARQDHEHYWFLVSRIMAIDIDELTDQLDDIDLDKESRRTARNTLRLLHRTIHLQDKISYYEESEQSLEKVLNIFIRMNSGGTALSYSDLLLSIAVAQWSKLDAREEIHKLVDELNQIGDGFSFSKDLVLKAGLMLCDIGSVGFKVENFSKENMAKLEENWEPIRKALQLAVNLLAGFGFNGYNLGADSALLPIAYYLFRRELGDSYLTRSEYAADRQDLRGWLIRSVLKQSGIWGSGLDTLLTTLCSKIKEHGQHGFPLTEINTAMTERGKSLRFEEEELQTLVELDYGNRRTFALLSLLFPGHDFSRHFHVDHIFPKGRFTRAQLKKAGISDEEQIDQWCQMANCLPNLQLLEGSLNNEKREKLPHEWYAMMWPDPAARANHLQLQAINTLPESLLGFAEFYQERRETLLGRLRHVLQTQQA
ncbi:DUF262 domain-containing protein [Aeromonas salmonicida]|uniref:DUF262 domain-containing protein n=1 Tax=Aeromonas salmonicida TaxID=645 RepID=UPI000B403754|nr:DUF262 domain-containing protein [Aeromonas salmonicida]ARW82934.1 hypothetical protein O23A_p2191 [Aeromonas salmonicida]